MKSWNTHSAPWHSASAGESGVTLVETMIAIAVLGITFLGLVQSLPLTIRMNSNARIGVSTLGLAQAKIEELKNKAASSIANYNALAGGTEKYTSDGILTTTDADAAFTLTWTIADGGLLDRSGNIGSKQISITATALKGDYGPKSTVSLTTESVRPTS